MMLVSRSDRGLIARWWFTVDRMLMFAILTLMAIGVLVSMAASPPVAERIGLPSFHFFKSQLIFLGPAIALLVGMSFLDVKQARRAALLALGISLPLMMLALKFGPEIKGAHRWINIGPIGLQPSEIAKPAFTVIAAWFLSEHIRRPEMPGQFLACALFAGFVGLLILQPDFGQTALTVMTFGLMLLVFGIRWIYVGGLAGVTALGVFLAYQLVPHVTSRIDRFLHPDKGDTFQVDTATRAFHNGGFMGAGPGGGEAKQVLPDAHTDFSFAVVGEEFGFVACMVLMSLFAFIVIRILARAKAEEEPFQALALTGLASMFGLQTIINMGVNVSLLPAKGMTLPFISYGGSSLLGLAFAMGLVLAFSRKHAIAIYRRQDWQAVPA
jgi:cell division protein FtsW